MVGHAVPNVVSFRLYHQITLASSHFINIKSKVFISLLFNDNSWFFQNNSCIIWNILKDNAISSYSYIISNSNSTKDFCPWANINIISNYWY